MISLDSFLCSYNMAIMISYRLTCSELNIVKSHANTVELELIVRIPNVHVSPRRGIKMIEAANNDLIIIIVS